MSLERKLPLLVIAVLVATLATAVGLAYREVRSASEAASGARLQIVGQELASLSATSIATRAKLLRDVSQSPAVRAATVVSATETASPERTPTSAKTKGIGESRLQLALQRLVLSNDSTLAIELWSANGSLIDSLGAAPEQAVTATGDSRQMLSIPSSRSPQTTMPNADTVQFFPFFEGRDHQVYYWITVPVLDSGKRVGWIAVQARIKPRPGADIQINRLLGDHTAAYFRNANNSFWTTLGGIAQQQPSGSTFVAPSIGNTGKVTSYTRTLHGRVLSTELPIAGTPWWIVVEADHSAVVAGASSLLLRFTLFSLPLLLAAVAVSWLLIRHALRPLVDLTRAATLVSRGDYSARVKVRHDDEVGRLGASFNTMAAEVDASQSKLARQVDEAHRLALELDRARDIAVSASKAKSNFLATMSHEIRTPINAIIGYADILDLGISGPLTPKQQENVHRIRTSSSHLLALINDVLDLSRIESGSMRLTTTHISTRQSIDAALALLQPAAAEKDIRVIVTADDHRADTYVGDERGVQQALANLLSNAVKFTKSGGEIRIGTSLASAFSISEFLDPSCTYVAISVTDTGIGIDENKIGRLFQPFTQLEAEGGNPYTRLTSGAGLGLSISRHLARMMGGDITVESTLQVGSTFTLWLPHEIVASNDSASDASGDTLDLDAVARADDASR
ncbi:MAG: ATP-binding protein [Gemmatimonadaceae bacterium]